MALRRGPDEAQTTQEGLDRLLALLDPERERAGLKYEALRGKLRSFFGWRGCRPPDELADEALDRACRRLSQGTEIQQDPARYVYGIARNLVREVATQRYGAPRHEELEPADLADPRSFEPEPDEAERAAGCLDRCLDDLPPETRRLVLTYYGDERNAEGRRRLAAELGVPMNALWIRVHRLRKRLEQCVRDCLDGRPPRVK